MKAQISYILFIFLFFGRVFCGNSQTATYQYLDLNTMLKDAKINALNQSLIKLPVVWTMRVNGSKYLIERKELVWLPAELLSADELLKSEKKTATIAGKNYVLYQSKAYFRFEVEKKWKKEAIADALKENNQLAPTLKTKEMVVLKKVPTYNSDYYSIFQKELHGLGSKNPTLPANLVAEFQAIQQLLAKNLEVNQ